jgi:hypothetical protein
MECCDSSLLSAQRDMRNANVIRFNVGNLREVSSRGDQAAESSISLGMGYGSFEGLNNHGYAPASTSGDHVDHPQLGWSMMMQCPVTAY